MDVEPRWPKKGDNPFLVKAADLSSPTWAALHWLESLNVDDSFLADAFKEAGDKVIRELSRGERYEHAERFFLPIAYLYRHSLELRMKKVISLAIELQLIEKEKKLSGILRGHNLHRLWNCVKKVAKAYWPNGPQEDLNAAGRIIQEFHNIDKSGQNLRYSKDLSGHSSLEKLPESVELTHLQDVFNAIFNFLHGCETGLAYEIEMRSEMLSDFCDDVYG
jgi:hypothetical protein